MRVMITGSGSSGSNAVEFDLPNNALSLAGMPKSTDSRGAPYETFVLGDVFTADHTAIAGYDRLSAAFVEAFLARLEVDVAAVEWRLEPSYEIGRDEEKHWRGQVRCRYSTHKELPK